MVGWQVNIHTDTLNEGGFVESMFFSFCSLECWLMLCVGTIAAIGKRTIHTYHSEGAGDFLISK